MAFMTDPENPKKAAPPAPEVDMWEDVEKAENVVRLTTAEFDPFIAANPSVLVMFYAPCMYSILQYFSQLCYH